jgi:hypothetical protein
MYFSVLLIKLMITRQKKAKTNEKNMKKMERERERKKAKETIDI